MKNFFFIIWFSFISLSEILYAGGFKFEVKLNSLGESTLNLKGDRIVANPNGGGLQSVQGKAKNEMGFTLGTGYEVEVNETIFALFGFSYTNHKTKTIKITDALDNGSLEGTSVALDLIGQYNAFGDFFMRLGLSFPILSRFKGHFDNSSGIDEVNMEGVMGIHVTFGYKIIDELRVALGYSMVMLEKEKGLTGVDIKINSNNFLFGVDFVF